jgi:hypothetical protein
VAEGGGLLNRCTVKSCTGGSNPPLSASESSYLLTIIYKLRVYLVFALFPHKSSTRELLSEQSISL